MKTGVLWHEVVAQLHAREYKDVTLEHQLADAGGMQLVRWPKQFDVIVTDKGIADQHKAMVKKAGVKLVLAE